MPITIDAVAIKSNAVGRFVSSEEYKKMVDHNAIFDEIESEDGSRFYMFLPCRGFDMPSEFDPEDFLWVFVDDEDDMGIEGNWSDFPFEFDIACQMSFVVDNPSESVMKFMKNTYDYSILDDKRFLELEKLFMEMDDDVWDEDVWNWDGDLVNEIHEILKKYNKGQLLDGRFSLPDFRHLKEFLKDGNMDTSYSTETIFVAMFTPNLKQLVKHMDFVQDVIFDIQHLENSGAIAFYKHNYELFEKITDEDSDDPIVELELDGFLVGPSIIGNGFIGSPQCGWERN